jgi:(p)ppGpp synthase/HD superfamily hydrolase
LSDGYADVAAHSFTVQDAIDIATKAHAGQSDKLGVPYIEHCIAVMGMFDADLEMKVAVLHDTVEDTDISLEDLRAAGCETEGVEAIDALSKRPGEPLEASMQRVRANPIAANVKLGDIAHNVSRIPKISDLATRKRLTSKYGKSLSLLGLAE